MNFQINTFRAQKPITTLKPPSKSKVSINNKDDKLTKKRRRLTLVCDNCKKRKIRCNKQLPCDSCLKSNISHSCAYHDTWPKKGTDSSNGDANDNTSTNDNQNNHNNSLSPSLPYISSARRPIVLDNNVDHHPKHKDKKKVKVNANGHEHEHEHKHEHEDSKIIDVYKQELERLKDRIKHLESINNIIPASSNELVPPSIPLPITLPSPMVPTSNTTTSFMSTQVVPIKLPPINWKSTTSSSTASYTNGSGTPIPSHSLTNATISNSNIASVIPIANGSSILTSFIGVNPVLTFEETVTSYKYSKSCPFSWSVLMMSDPQLRLVLEFLKLDKTKLDDISCPEVDLSHGKKKFDLNYSLILKDTVVSKPIEGVDFDVDLKTRLISSLPNYNVVLRLIDQYFEFNYPIMPFVDETIFRNDIKKIIKFDNTTNKIIDLKFTDFNYDLCIIGILLIILRLSFLSFLRNNHDYNRQFIEQEKELFEKPINLDHVSLSRECLFKILYEIKYENLIVVQFLFYLRYYIRISPEDGYRKDAIDYNKQLIELALTLKINQDPDTFPESIKLSNSEKSLRRKIWHFIVMADIHNSLVFGNPSRINAVNADTKKPFPVTSELQSNLKNFNHEQDIFNGIYSKSYKFYGSMKAMSDFVTNSDGYQLVRLIEQLNQFEIDVSEYFKELFQYLLTGFEKEELDGIKNFKRIYHVKLYLSVINFITTIYYYIYLFYEDINLNISFFYLKKTIIYINELIPFYKKLVFNKVLRSDFLYNPTLQGVIHKSSQILLSLHIKFKGDDSYKELRDTMFKNYIIFVEILDNLSTRYYYSWKITKGHRYFYYITNSDKFEKFFLQQKQKQENNGGMRYNDYQIRELQGIIEYSLKRIEQEEDEQQRKQQEIYPIQVEKVDINQKVTEESNESINNGSLISSSNITNSPNNGFDLQIDQQWIDLVFQFSGKNELFADSLVPTTLALDSTTTNITTTNTIENNSKVCGESTLSNSIGEDFRSNPYIDSIHRPASQAS
ncbi:fungal-specific transcription factor [Scheffersomyces coipomensis]|uniref:fungal-specific transcription factor n=1 Tax=Scheffersomyces coipomensis TaxID=1788519 RepID=UPI00315C768A